MAADENRSEDDRQKKIDTSAEVRARIEHALHTRTAPRGTMAARLEQLVKTGGGALWAQLRKRPSLGVVLAGGVGLALATVVGVGELTIGIAAGYAAYQVLREGVAPETAAKNIVKELERFG